MAPQRNTGAGAEAELPAYVGHYRLESCLGSGGMGVVHLARSASGMKLAVKVVHAEFARDPEFRGRFRQEVAAARRVSGAFTAPVVDADPEAERPWMATLFIPGPTLAQQVKRNGPMPAAQLRRLMAGLAEALRDIHRVGVVHRDLKPSNVLLAEDGPKVIDFGISRPKDSELRTETGKLIGTPPFMAPEQFRRPREVGPAADIFALGSVMVHAATGRGPFDSDSPYVVAYQVVHDEPDLTGVPEGLAPLVLRCLAKEPEQRPSPDELMRELRSVAASYDTQAFIPAQRVLAEEAWGGQEPGGAQGTGAEGAGSEDTGSEGAEAEGGGSAGGGSEGSASGDGASGAGAVVKRLRSKGRAGGRAEGRANGPAGEPASVVRRARRRRLVLAGLAAAVLVGGALASVRLLGGADGAPEDATPRTATAGFSAWAAKPTTGGGAVPQCAYGAELLLCSRPGQVFALDPADGTRAWTRSAATGRTSGPPVVSGGLVQPDTDGGRRLAALDPASGAEVWHRDLPRHAATRYAGGMLLVTGADGTVTGVDSTTGETSWERRIPGHAMPYFTAFAGDPLAYAATPSDDGSGTRVSAVDPATGEVRWTALLEGTLEPVGSADGGSASGSGSESGSGSASEGEGTSGAVYFTAVDAVYGDTDAVVRYDPASRAVDRVALPVPRQDTQAAVHGDVVYVLAAGGSLEAFDLARGKRLWHLETSVSRGSAPVADGRQVYFTAADGRLMAVDGRGGRLVGQTPARLGTDSGKVSGEVPAPVLVGTRVYAAAPDGTVFGVDGRAPGDW
ncbi:MULTISPECIES: serine/threonine-protein kinase [unclassified Streptomyces]|uniref:serine/threonine-protein kinase n=1 Tax=unclassified Streptomyces TaxID=2593676 RepID=UPI0009390EC5|nr:serine/threonine-protein kinase [Streptomyces sp. TSRI0107]OKJ79706.1 serine/threonine protein kinase [Streptomyces sp. TSRI0107]